MRKNWGQITPAVVLLCSSCATVAGVATAVGISSTTLAQLATAANTAYQAGQLFCSLDGAVVAAVDATNGSAFLVTNKSAAEVAAVCKAIYPSSIPVVPPANPTAVPAVAVIPPPA